MPAKSHHVRAFRQKLRERAFDVIGRVCVFCGTSEQVEAAHVKPTKLNGAGRGLDRRYRDVLKHPECYASMCKKHHAVFDRLVSSLFKELRKESKKEEEIPF